MQNSHYKTTIGSQRSTMKRRKSTLQSTNSMDSVILLLFLHIMHLWNRSEPLSTMSRNGQDIKQTPSSGGFDDRCRRDDTDSFTLAHHIFYPRFPGSSFRARKQHRKCGNSTRCSNGAFSALSCSSNSAFFFRPFVRNFPIVRFRIKVFQKVINSLRSCVVSPISR